SEPGTAAPCNVAGVQRPPNSIKNAPDRLASMPVMALSGIADMKITVLGGHGLVGARLVSTLRHRGHEVIAASRRSGVDALTGEGLANAVAGAHVVVNVMNSPLFDGDAVMDFFRTSSRNL